MKLKTCPLEEQQWNNYKTEIVLKVEATDIFSLHIFFDCSDYSSFALG